MAAFVGLGALGALATGRSASDGIGYGIVLGCLLVLVGFGYVGWGGLLDWWSRRHPAR